MLRCTFVYYAFYLISFLSLGSCVSHMASLNDSMRQERDLAFNEMRIELGDLSHFVQAQRTEIQLLQEQVQEQEEFIGHTKRTSSHFEANLQQMLRLEKKLALLEKQQERILSDLRTLSKYYDQSGNALGSVNEKLRTLQVQLDQQAARLSDVQQLKTTLTQVSQAIRDKQTPAASRRYRVKPGDNLEKISKQLHVSVTEIKKRNHLNDDKIFIGQELEFDEP